MRIGLDMDDTICSTEETVIEYANKYCIEYKIEQDEIWNNETIRRKFLSKYLETIYLSEPLKENAKDMINKLKKLGHEIIIITARSNNYISMSMEELIKNYLTNNGIDIDKIIINSKDKVDACRKYKIDIMLEDNLYNYNMLTAAGIKTILYDEKENNINIKNRITNWKNFMDYI